MTKSSHPQSDTIPSEEGAEACWTADNSQDTHLSLSCHQAMLLLRLDLHPTPGKIHSKIKSGSNEPIVAPGTYK